MATYKTNFRFDVRATKRVELIARCEELASQAHSGESKTKSARAKFERAEGRQLEGAPLAEQRNGCWWVLMHSWDELHSGKGRNERLRYEPVVYNHHQTA